MGPTKPLEGGTITEKLLSWAANQGPATMLLFLLAAMVAWGGHYAITTAIPSHLQEIKSGYREVSEQHDKTVDKLIKSWDSERAILTEERKQLWDAALKARGASTKPNGLPEFGSFGLEGGGLVDAVEPDVADPSK